MADSKVARKPSHVSENALYDMKSRYPEEYSTVDKVGTEKLLAWRSCFV